MLECLRDRRWPRRRQIFAIAVVMAGTLLAVGLFEQKSDVELNIAGVLYGLASAVTYSLFLFLTCRLQADYDPVQKSAMMINSDLGGDSAGMTIGILLILAGIMIAEHTARQSAERTEGLEELR